MATEIERKFLVKSDAWKAGATAVAMRQGYLCREHRCTVRVRVAGDHAFLTIKGKGEGISRPEYEYPIPVADAAGLLAMCGWPLIEKTRHLVMHDGWKWEVDEFHGDNAGLVVAEIELPDAEATPGLPSWIGDDVSHLPRYFNSNLAKHPFGEWSAEERAAHQ